MSAPLMYGVVRSVLRSTVLWTGDIGDCGDAFSAADASLKLLCILVKLSTYPMQRTRDLRDCSAQISPQNWTQSLSRRPFKPKAGVRWT